MRIAVCDDNAVFLQFFKSMLANELESRSVKAEIETFTKAESFFQHIRIEILGQRTNLLIRLK